MVGGGGGGGLLRGGLLRAGLLRPSPDEERQLLNADDLHALYDVHHAPLASGPFAVLRRCVHRASGRACVAKFSSRRRLGEDCSAELRHEVALLSRCADCERIVRLLAAFATPRHVVMVLEYLPGGDLQALLDADVVPVEGDVRRFMRQLLEALHFLHSRLGAAHLDIKPQNLVLTAPFPAGDVKLCDLEVARVVAGAAPVRELLGTPDYVAPEILHYDPITLAADIWSCGVTAYALLTGFSPFGGESDQETFCNVARARVDFPPEIFHDVSPAAVDFMRRVLAREPRLRPSAADCLRDPWIVATGDGHAATGEGELRRFLSKSREALVERAKGSLRRGLLSQSQMSLSRSREKLYGLRSLSQSHDLLQLLGVGEGGLPAPLVAAALASAASTPSLHAKEEFCGSSRVSLAALGPASGVAAHLGDGGAARGRCMSESAASTATEQAPAAITTKDNKEGGDAEDEEEERRFSVWQLVRAFDRHQQSPSATRKGTDSLRSLIVQMEAEGHRKNDNEQPLL